MTDLVSNYILTTMSQKTERRGRIRKTAEERREEILEAAISEFSARGLRGASVEDLAASVGVSQPYVYRLFGTKKDLFLAATGRVRERIQEAFRRAAEAEPEDPLGAMGRAYDSVLSNREEMLLLLQGFVADDAEVRDVVGERYAALWRFVAETTGASEAELWSFFASGMLLTINSTIGLMDRLGQEQWLQSFMRDEH